jgi:phosphatidylglycerophosphatase A
MKLIDRLLLFTAEGFGSGMIPVAPGTFGSIPGVALCWAMGQLHAVTWQFGVVWIAMFAVGIPLCTRAARLRNRKDPGSVVWDEMTAFPLMFLLVPVTGKSLVLGFVLFRIFDIAKPWPIRRFEKLPDGLGIMADDQIAAAYATICVMLVLTTIAELAA